MFTLPVAAFFGARQVLSEEFELKPPMDQLGAAIASVVVVNLIIFAYIRKAFKEERQSQSSSTKSDDDKKTD